MNDNRGGKQSGMVHEHERHQRSWMTEHMCPLMGNRYKCTDCVEKIGFDLCEDCYNSFRWKLQSGTTVNLLKILSLESINSLTRCAPLSFISLLLGLRYSRLGSSLMVRLRRLRQKVFINYTGRDRKVFINIVLASKFQKEAETSWRLVTRMTMRLYMGRYCKQPLLKNLLHSV